MLSLDIKVFDARRLMKISRLQKKTNSVWITEAPVKPHTVINSFSWEDVLFTKKVLPQKSGRQNGGVEKW